VQQAYNLEALQLFHQLSHEVGAPACVLLAHDDHSRSGLCDARLKRAEQRQTDVAIANSTEYSSKLCESTANIFCDAPAFLIFDQRKQFANAARCNPGVVDAVRIAVKRAHKVGAEYTKLPLKQCRG